MNQALWRTGHWISQCYGPFSFGVRFETYEFFNLGLLKYLFILKALRKECPSMFPKSEAPMEIDANSRILCNISFGVPSRGALLHSSIKVPGIWAPLLMLRHKGGTLWREMPVSRAFLKISSKLRSKGTLPTQSLHF
jgi:hypothetical protein